MTGKSAGDGAPTMLSNPGTVSTPEPLSRGELVDRYMVLGPLGAGGMGVVYAAYDPELDRKVALKLLLPGRGDQAAARARLRREAQAMGRLSHRNVVTVHDVGEHDGRIYIAMEYVDGQTLSQWRVAENRSWSEVLDVFVQAARGLAAAHARDLLHRDIKPDNLMVDVDGTTRVMDFGLVLAAHGGRSTGDEGDDGVVSRQNVTLPVTQTGAVIGTPAYMAPEQLRGRRVDARTDQFSFCVALWESLYGERPFAGDGLTELSREIAGGHRRAPPPGRSVPSWLRQTVERGLSPKPDDRWPSMDALLEALSYDPKRRWGRWKARGASLAFVGVGGFALHQWMATSAQHCTGATAQLAEAWGDERRADVSGAILGIGAPYASTVWTRSEALLDAYAAEWVTMYTETCEATTIRGEQSVAVMDLRMACLQRAKVALSASTRVLATADADVVSNAHALLDDLQPLSRCADVHALQTETEPPMPGEVRMVNTAQAHLARAKAEREAGRIEISTEAVEAARSLAKEVEHGPLRAELALEDGRVLQLRGEYEKAEAAYRQALQLAIRHEQRQTIREASEQLLYVVGYQQQRFDEGLQQRELLRGLADPGSVDEANLFQGLANIRFAQGSYVRATELFEQTLAILEAEMGGDHPQVATTLNNLANAHYAQGGYQEAVELHTRALSIREAALGPEHPEVAGSLNNLAGAHQALGSLDAAATAHARSLAIRERALGPDHPSVATTLSNLAVVRNEQGAHDDAALLASRALAIREKTLEAGHPHIAVSLNSLALVHVARGKYDDAAAAFARVVEILERALGPNHPDVAKTLDNLASTRLLQGDDEEAARLYTRALAIREASVGEAHPDLAGTLVGLAEVRRAQGSLDEATRLFARAAALWEAALGPDHPLIARALLGLADVAVSQSRSSDAAAPAARAVEILEARGVPSSSLARARFLLARALGDREDEALALAREARAFFAQDGARSVDDLAEIDAWLAADPIR